MHGASDYIKQIQIWLFKKNENETDKLAAYSKSNINIMLGHCNSDYSRSDHTC